MVKDQASTNNSFWMCWHLQRSNSHLYIKEWILEEQQDSTTFWKRQNSAKLFSIQKFTLNFSFQVHILEILKSYEFVSDLYCEHHWLYIKCSTSDIFFVILFDRSLLQLCLSNRSLLIVFRSIGSLLQLCLNNLTSLASFSSEKL